MSRFIRERREWLHLKDVQKRLDKADEGVDAAFRKFMAVLEQAEEDEAIKQPSQHDEVLTPDCADLMAQKVFKKEGNLSAVREAYRTLLDETSKHVAHGVDPKIRAVMATDMDGMTRSMDAQYQIGRVCEHISSRSHRMATWQVTKTLTGCPCARSCYCLCRYTLHSQSPQKDM